MIDEMKVLDGFELTNLLEEHEEKNEEIKVFTTLEMIDYCLKHDVKSMIFQSIQSTNGNEFRYLSFDSEGELTSTINKEDLNKKYAIQIKTMKFKNALGMRLKKDSLWVRSKSSERMSPADTLDRTIQWITDEPALSCIDEIYHKNDEGHELVLARRIKQNK